MTDFSTLPQLVVNGLVVGSILALAGMGLTLVYGILRLANFAHGDFVTLGAFLAFFFAVLLAGAFAASSVAIGAGLIAVAAVDTLWTSRLSWGERTFLIALGAPLAAIGAFIAFAESSAPGTTDAMLVAATLLSIVFSVAALLALERLVWRPLRAKRATVLSLVIVSIGVSLVARNLLQIGFGTGNRSFERPTEVSPYILGVQISVAQQAAFVATALLILALHFFLSRTRSGKAMRAMADNLELARISGVDVDREVTHVWVLAAALTAISGVFLTLVANNVMNINMGLGLLLPLFAAVILGGIGSPYGAIAGGLIVGIAMKTAALWVGTGYEVAAALAVLIVVLLIRPQGLFGGRVS